MIFATIEPPALDSSELRLLFNESLSALFPTAVFVAAATNSNPGSSRIALLLT